MTRTALAALSALALLASPAAAEQAKRLVTIVTAPEAQTQLMGMVLTMQALQQGAEVHILLCGPAADIALNDAPEAATAPQPPMGMSPKGLLAKILENPSAKAEVCAIYLPGKGLDASALTEGVTPARPADMAARIMDEGAKVMSF